MPPEVARAVRVAQRVRSMTQEAVALHIGISRPQLANALKGRFGLSRSAAENLMHGSRPELSNPFVFSRRVARWRDESRITAGTEIGTAMIDELMADPAFVAASMAATRLVALVCVGKEADPEKAAKFLALGVLLAWAQNGGMTGASAERLRAAAEKGLPGEAPSGRIRSVHPKKPLPTRMSQR